jgi:hypothetical protein
MAAVERWVCFRLDSRVGYVFGSLEGAEEWLKDPGRTTGWFISPVYAEGMPRV